MARPASLRQQRGRRRSNAQYRAARRNAVVGARGDSQINVRLLVDPKFVEDSVAIDGLHDPRKAKLVELKFCAGLSLDQIAKVLEISPATADRDWAYARAWLHAEISKTA